MIEPAVSERRSSSLPPSGSQFDKDEARMIDQKVVDPIEDHRNGAAAEDALQPAGAPRRSQRGLDWFAFFMADIQTGWGPFVAAYLTSVAWTQFDIGLILTIGTLAALALQIPAGALVDRVPANVSWPPSP